jgi:hypothetical protein
MNWARDFLSGALAVRGVVVMLRKLRLFRFVRSWPAPTIQIRAINRCAGAVVLRIASLLV